MIKNRSFMFGLGTGLIAGALLLQVMITGGAAPLSKEKLIKEAAKLNLTVTDPSATPTATSNTGNTGEGTEGSGKEGTAAVVPSATESAAPASPASTPQAAVEPSAAAAPSGFTTPVKACKREETIKCPSCASHSGGCCKRLDICYNSSQAAHLRKLPICWSKQV